MDAKQAVFPIGSDVSKSGHLIVGGCDAVELVRRFGTPLYILDEETLRARCRQFKTEFGRRKADTTICYAGKAYLSRALCRIIREEGLGLDVVSGGELAIAQSAQFPMDLVYFHGNNKSTEELRAALRSHVGRIVVDNLDELKLLSQLADESGHIPEILLRLTPGVDSHTHEHISTGKVDTKFGLPLFMATEAVIQAMAAPSLNLVGLHFHLGSQITDSQPYQEALEAVLEFAATIKENYGLELEEMDIGGGFAAQYLTDAPVPSIASFAEDITTRLAAKCRELKLASPALTIEPGRAIVAQAGIALYQVGSIKDIPGIRRYVAVDGGMADNIRQALYGARYEAVLANRMNEKATDTVTIAGRFCESGDILVRDALLPPAATGDIVAIPACGAYCLPMASNYNAVPRPAVVMTNAGEARLIRRRETIEDLTRNDLD